MGLSIGARLRHAWSVFRNKDPSFDTGPEYSVRPDQPTFHFGNERSIIAAVFNRIAVDVASMKFEEVVVDQNGNYQDVVTSGLTEALTVQANIDQSGPQLIQDICMNVFDGGVIALVPTVADFDPITTGSYDIRELRVGEIIGWMPEHVRVRLYNDKKGFREDFVLPKKMVAIVENPFYSVMNEPNSTLQRLIHKLNILDAIDKQSGSGKLDIIIKLPFAINTERKQNRAEQRRKDIEMQLEGSKYGIAYIDTTEQITQLNRPAENNLMNQIDYLTKMLYGQLGITEDVMNGVADEQTMLNYYNRSVEPVASAIVNAMIRKFLTKTARTKGHTIKYFRDPFKLVPVEQIAEIADKMTRNEILTSNEVRGIIGYKPSEDPRANELRNKNLNAQDDQLKQNPTPQEETGVDDGLGELFQNGIGKE